jgi:hypothetical protein
MKTNSVDDLPHWARKAMGYTALGYSGAPLAGDTDPEGPCGLLERLAKRVAARWPDIEKDVLPSLAVLSNNVKGRFFREIFRAGMRSAGDTPRAARQEVRRLDAICEAIAVKAGELADLLEQQAAIDKDGLAECDMPYLAELLLDAGVEYPVWSKVATSTEMLRFWTVVFGQTGPGPELADVLRALVQRRRGGPFDPPLRVRATEPAFRNRQASQSDHVRTLLRAIDEFPRRRADGLPPDDIWIWGGDAVCLPHGFDLPDSAVATLVEALFGLPEGQPDVHVVKACRVSRRQQPDADGLADTPCANRTAPPPAAPAPRPAPTNAPTDLFTRRWSH